MFHSYNYTNAIFQENQEEVETHFICMNKTWYCSNIVFVLFYRRSLLALFQGSICVHVPWVVQLLLHKDNFPGKPGRATNNFVAAIKV